MFLFNSDGSTFSSDKEGDGFKYLLNINTTGVCPGREYVTLLNSSITVNADWTHLPQLYGTVFLKTFDMCNQLAFSRNF
jgi:hypothetical protein